MKIQHGPVPHYPTLFVSEGEPPPDSLMTQLERYHCSMLQVSPVRSPLDPSKNRGARIEIRTYTGPHRDVTSIVLDRSAVAAVIGALQRAYDAIGEEGKE